MTDLEVSLIEEFNGLEKVCNEIYGEQHGVTKYIEDMEDHSMKYSPIYKDDYYKLKHARYLRNGLVHADKGDAECTREDVDFIINFHNRIINGTDPLTIRKREDLILNEQNKNDATVYRETGTQNKRVENKRRRRKIDRRAILVVLFLIAAFLALFFKLIEL